jgi:hypothetical protein
MHQGGVRSISTNKEVLPKKPRRLLNRSTRGSYTSCLGHVDMARLRVLPVCQYCMA